MGFKLYNKMPGYTKEMDNYKAFKKELEITYFIPCFLLSGEMSLCNL
jgi:hypothetical protein